MKTTAYPSHVGETSIAQGLIADDTVGEGTIVEKLEGRVVPYARIPDAEIRNAYGFSARIASMFRIKFRFELRWQGMPCDSTMRISSGNFG